MSIVSGLDPMARKHIAPRILPRGLVDFAISSVVGVFQTFILFGAPAAIAFFLTGSTAITFGTFCVAYVFFLLFCVRHISLGEDGIKFHRLLGTPKFLPWSRITSISPASRRELILRGWLWPIFPAREMTASLTSLNHYRIAWVDGFCYYPPRDAHDLETYSASRFGQQNA